MEQVFIKHINALTKNLNNILGFTVKDEFNDGQSYFIEYNSKSKIFVVKIERYFREFYVTLYRLTDPKDEINLFNLLGYLDRGNESELTSNSFLKEKDIEECYRKQLNQISTLIYENYAVVNDFFNSENYRSEVIALRNYVINKHPELFKRT